MAQKEVVFSISIAVNDHGQLDENHMEDVIRNAIEAQVGAGNMTHPDDKSTVVREMLVEHLITCDVSTPPQAAQHTAVAIA